MDENIPYALSVTSKNGNISFNNDRIRFFIKTCAPTLNEINIDSISRFTVCRTVNNIYVVNKKTLCDIKDNLGDRIGKDIITIHDKINEKLLEIKIEEFIISFLCAEIGKYFNKPLFKPSKLRVESKVNKEYKDVAIPICEIE